MVDYLIERPEIGKEERIEALELLGASFANDKDNYDVGLAYTYLERAMKMRWQDDIIEKVGEAPVAAYDNWRESRAGPIPMCLTPSSTGARCLRTRPGLTAAPS